MGLKSINPNKQFSVLQEGFWSKFTFSYLTSYAFLPALCITCIANTGDDVNDCC